MVTLINIPARIIDELETCAPDALREAGLHDASGEWAMRYAVLKRGRGHSYRFAATPAQVRAFIAELDFMAESHLGYYDDGDRWLALSARTTARRLQRDLARSGGLIAEEQA